jgi:hypothetical protein
MKLLKTGCSIMPGTFSMVTKSGLTSDTNRPKLLRRSRRSSVVDGFDLLVLV